MFCIGDTVYCNRRKIKTTSSEHLLLAGVHELGAYYENLNATK